jgi:flotillin
MLSISNKLLELETILPHHNLNRIRSISVACGLEVNWEATLIIGSLILLAFVLFVVGIWFLQRYYAKATLDTALIRTGMGGQRVVTDGGCISLPIVHQLQKVSMQTLPLTAARSGKNAALTKDQIRADIQMAFEVRVEPSEGSIANAAQSLGQRIARNGEAVQEVLESTLVDAILNASASRTLDEIHLDRVKFTADVSGIVEAQATRLGLTIVAASLVSVDQSDFSQLNENNAFNAKGMRKLAELISEERKARIKVETETDVAIREHKLTQHQQELNITRQEREAEISQAEHLDKMEADAKSRSQQAQASATLATEEVRIEKERLAKASQVENDEALRKTEMTALLSLEEAKITNDISLSKKRAEESKTKAAEEEAKAQVILAAEHVQAQKDRAVEVREQELAQLRQDKQISLENERVKSDVETMLVRAQADAKVKTTEAEAEKLRMEAEAAGQSALNTAENTLSDAVIGMRLEERKLDRMPEIMTQMMKPVEKIDSIRINHIGGMGGGQASGEGVDGAFGSAMDQILGMAVRLPAMKQMGEEIGVDLDINSAGRTADYANRIKSKDTKTTKE